jgi:hypothetical protein
MAFLTLGALGLASPEQYFSDCQARGSKLKYNTASKAVYIPIYKAYTSGRARLDAAHAKLISYQSKALRLARKDDAAAQALDQIESGLDAVQQASAALANVHDQFQAALATKYGCQINYKRIGGKAAREWAAAMSAAGNATLPPHGRILATLQGAESRIRAQELEQQRAYTKQQEAEQQAAQAAARQHAGQQAEQQAIWDRQAAEEDRLRRIEEQRLAREAAARQGDLEFQRMQLEEQRRLADLEREYQDQERARIVEIEQRRLDAEMRREHQAIAAQERRVRLQEAAALRAEEAALRREEREAQLQQLVMLQELASQGLPAHLIPGGLPSPAAAAQAQPAPAAWSPYGLPAQPAPAPQPAPAAWSPYGLPAQPAPAPQQQQQPGWGSFGPGAEKF